MKVKYLICLPFISMLGLSASAQQEPFINTLNKPNHWVDSVFRKMSRREKVAQLFFVRAHTDRGKVFEDSIAHVIRKERIGGLVFFQGGPGRQTALTNRYQQEAKIPLLVTIDGEWGLGMRLDSTVSYPYQMTLGAVQNNELIYKMGLEVAKDFKRIGMHMNLAPDVDVNNNAKNPVIGFRSFGENKYNVAAKGAAYMKGMQDGGILVSLKHFPGHGDTDVDSHADLPQLKFTRQRLDSLELYPFKELIKSGASGVMVAHMNIPALDTTANLPSTLSRPIITGLLKEQLGFKGLIISDAMEMKGVVKFFPDGEADVRAVIAGNDILEISENTKRAVKLIRKAIRHDRLSWDQVNESVKKILMAKYWSGSYQRFPQNVNNVVADVNRPESIALNQQLADAAITLLKGKASLTGLDSQKKTALVCVGPTDVTAFQTDLKAYFPNSMYFILSKKATPAEIAKVTASLKDYDQVIVGVHDVRKRPGSVLDLGAELKQFIAGTAQANGVISVFANPYAMAGLPGIEQAGVLMVGYQKDDIMLHAAAKVIKKEIVATGKLPVTINANFKYGDGQ